LLYRKDKGEDEDGCEKQSIDGPVLPDQAGGITDELLRLQTNSPSGPG
jgi:hypothetical protein